MASKPALAMVVRDLMGMGLSMQAAGISNKAALVIAGEAECKKK